MIKIVLTSFVATSLFAFKIDSYKPIKGCTNINGNEFRVLREIKIKNKKMFLSVNTSSLNTKYLQNIGVLNKCNPKSRYKTILNYATTPPYPLENDGLTHGSKGLYLTTDLCPSSKSGFEDRLYKNLIKTFPKPVPVTLFITKRWINKHKKEFEQFKTWQKENLLNISWGNHTAKHIYHPKAKLKHNFILSPEENLPKDILDLKTTLIENGVKPSIFFRFPGLISDKKSVQIVKNLGLIPIGSNAWLAKGQKPKNGSIILVHGNKNEPIGIDIFLKLLKNGKIRELDDIKNIR